MAPLNELADLLYEAARDIEQVAREFAWAGSDVSGAWSLPGEHFATTRKQKLRDIGLPVLAAMKWDEHKLGALKHALAIEEATK